MSTSGGGASLAGSAVKIMYHFPLKVCSSGAHLQWHCQSPSSSLVSRASHRSVLYASPSGGSNASLDSAPPHSTMDLLLRIVMFVAVVKVM